MKNSFWILLFGIVSALFAQPPMEPASKTLFLLVPGISNDGNGISGCQWWEGQAIENFSEIPNEFSNELRKKLNRFHGVHLQSFQRPSRTPDSIAVDFGNRGTTPQVLTCADNRMAPLIGLTADKEYFEIETTGSSEIASFLDNALAQWFAQELLEAQLPVSPSDSVIRYKVPDVQKQRDLDFLKWVPNIISISGVSVDSPVKKLASGDRFPVISFAGDFELREWILNWKSLHNGTDPTLSELYANRPDLVPSRFVVVAHSMGGLTVRELLRSPYYNGDIDKVFTFDTPHLGSGAGDHVTVREKDHSPEYLWIDGLSMHMGIAWAFAAKYLANITSNEKNRIACEEFKNKTKIVGKISFTNCDNFFENISDDILWHTFQASILNNFSPRIAADLLGYSVNYSGLKYMALDRSLRSGISPDWEDLRDDPTVSSGYLPPAFRIHYVHGVSSFSTPLEYKLIADNPIIAVGLPLIPKGYVYPKLAYFNASDNEDNPDDEKESNARFAQLLQKLGLTFTEFGSLVVPEKSGRANGVKLFERSDIDVDYYKWNLADKSLVDGNVEAIFPIVSEFARTLWRKEHNYIEHEYSMVSSAAQFGVDKLPFMTNSQKTVWKAIISVGFALLWVYDLAEYLEKVYRYSQDNTKIANPISSHQWPNIKSLDTKAASRSYDGFTSDGVASQLTVSPTVFEDDLYNLPHVSMKVEFNNGKYRPLFYLPDIQRDSLDTRKASEVEDSLAALGVVPVALTTNWLDSTALKKVNYFKSEWNIKGTLKFETYDRVDGPDAGSGITPSDPPIRRVHRYYFPENFLVTDFPYGFDFVVDDVRPEILRQVVLDFNRRFKIIWVRVNDVRGEATGEYRVFIKRANSNAEALATPPERYRIGNGVSNAVRLPIDEKGAWRFILKEWLPEGELLGNLYEDGFNELFVQTVNEVGKANTQLFTFMFQATPPFAKTEWPAPDAVLSFPQDTFSVVGDFLGYPGMEFAAGGLFSIKRADGEMVAENVSIDTNSVVNLGNSQERLKIPVAGIALDSGDFILETEIATQLDGQEGAKQEMRIPFSIDSVPPSLSLTEQSLPMNPALNSIHLQWRFSDDREKLGQARTSLLCGDSLIMDNFRFGGAAASPDDSLSLSGWYSLSVAPGDSLQGINENCWFRVDATDMAVPNLDAWIRLIELRNSSDTGEVAPLWDAMNWLGFHRVRDSVEVSIDMVPPKGEMRLLNSLVGRGDSLEIEYRLADKRYSADDTLSYPVRVNLTFTTIDSNSVAHGVTSLHDVNVEELNLSPTFFTYNSQLPDGKYLVRASVVDVAGNQSEVKKWGTNTTFEDTVQFDRTAPVVHWAFSSRYTMDTASVPDTVSIKWLVEEMDLAKVNRNAAAVTCSLAMIDPKGVKQWSGSVEHNQIVGDSLIFDVAFPSTHRPSFSSLLQSAGNSSPGQWSAEIRCRDGFDNAVEMGTSFFVSERWPKIASPGGSSIVVEQGWVFVEGEAPEPFPGSPDGFTGYELSWRRGDSTSWHCAGVEVNSWAVADSSCVSRYPVSSISRLGVWDARNLEPGQNYWLRVKTFSGERFLVDSTEIYLTEGTLPVEDEWKPVVSGVPAQHRPDWGSKLTFKVGVNTTSEVTKAYKAWLTLVDAGGNLLRYAVIDTLYSSILEGSGRYDASSHQGVHLWRDSADYWHIRAINTPRTYRIIVGYDSLDVVHPGELRGVELSNLPSGFTLAEENIPVGVAGYGADPTKIFNASLRMDIAAGTNAEISFQLPRSGGSFMMQEVDEGSDGLIQVASNELIVGDGASSDQWAIESKLLLPIALYSNSGNGESVEWDGLVVGSARFPESGLAKLSVEMQELGSGATNVSVLDTTFEIVQGSLTFALKQTKDRLSVNTELIRGDSLYSGSIRWDFGVLGREGKVRAGIKLKDGTLFHMFTPAAGEIYLPQVDSAAYSFVWNGLNQLNQLPEPDTLTFFMEGIDPSTDQVLFSQERLFELEHRNWIPAQPGEAELVVTDSVPGYPGYVSAKPLFVLDGQVNGKRMPVREFDYEVAYTGSQDVRVYRPERFSLKIQRRRDKIPVVVYQKFSGVEQYFKNRSCGIAGGHYYQYRQDLVYLDRDRSYNEIKVEYSPSGNDAEVGVHGFSYEAPQILEIAVFPYNPDSSSGLAALDGDAKKYFDDPNPKASFRLFYKSFAVHIAKKSILSFVQKDNEHGTLHSCTPSSDSDTAAVVCEDKLEEATPGYTPHAEMFEGSLRPTGDSGAYLSNVSKLYGGLTSICNNTRPKKFNAVLRLKVQGSYWKAPFGYNNLANRSVRFDPKNKVLYDQGPLKDGAGSIGYAKKYSTKTGSLLLPFGGESYALASYSDTNVFWPANFQFEISLAADSVIAGAKDSLFFEFAASEAVNNGSAEFIAVIGKQNGNSTKILERDQPAFVASLRSNAPQGSRKLAIEVKDLYSSVPKQYHIDVHRLTPPSLPSDGNTSNSVRLDWPISFNKTKALAEASLRSCSPTNLSSCKVLFLNGSGIKIGAAAEAWPLREGENYLDWDADPTILPDNPLHLDTASIIEKRSAVIPNGQTFTSVSLTPNSSELQGMPGLRAQVSLPDSVKTSITVKLKGDTNQVEFHAQPVLWSSKEDPLLNEERDWDRDGRRSEESNGIAGADDDGDGLIDEDRAGHLRAVQNVPAIGVASSYSVLGDVYPYSVNPDSTPNSYSLGLKSGSAWVHNPDLISLSLSSWKAYQRDGSIHEALEVVYDSSAFSTTAPGMRQLSVSYKAKDWKRRKELLELAGRLPASAHSYSIDYIDRYGTINTLAEGLQFPSMRDSGEHVLAYLDASKLQGATSLFLRWNENGAVRFKQLNVQIGEPLVPGEVSVVSSLFKEVSVRFPENAYNQTVPVTVRVTSPADELLTFGQNLTVLGPVVEVLPSMHFSDDTSATAVASQWPVIQMRLSKEQVNAMHVPLEYMQIYKLIPGGESGLLDRIEPLRDLSFLFTGTGLSSSCANEISGDNQPLLSSCKGLSNWDEVIVMAHTPAFSKFALLDSRSTWKGKVELVVDPIESRSKERRVSVLGITAQQARLTIDDDLFPFDAGDSTAAIELALDSIITESDSGFSALITLPDLLFAGTEVDSAWIQLSSRSGSSPVKALNVKLFPGQFDLACSGSDTIWFGYDGGQLLVPYLSNQPGHLELIVKRGPTEVVRYFDTLTAPQGALIVQAIENSTSLSDGVYRAYLSGKGFDDEQKVVVGPVIRVDRYAPMASLSGDISSSHDTLGIIAKWNTADLESGISERILRLYLGNALVLREYALESDTGSVNIRVAPWELEACSGCEIKAKLTVKDKGGNSAFAEWSAGPAYHLPAGLAFWYPMDDSWGTKARDIALHASHQLLANVGYPWIFGADGLFYRPASDVSEGIVAEGALDSTKGVTIEWWLKSSSAVDRTLFSWWRGYPSTPQWSLRSEQDSLKLNGDVSASLYMPESGEKAWNHWVAVVSSDSLKLLKNGELVSNAAMVGTFAPSADGSLRVGGEEQSLGGTLGLLRVWKRALSLAEATGLYSVESRGLNGILFQEAEKSQLTGGVVIDADCALQSSSYVSADSSGSILVTFDVASAGKYSLLIAARNAEPGTSLPVSIAGYSGLLKLGTEGTWKPYWWRRDQGSIERIALSAGRHTLNVQMPTGSKIDWVALAPDTTVNLRRVSTATTPSVPKVTVRAMDVSPSDPNWVTPRVVVTNRDSLPLEGFKLRYYFNEMPNGSFVAQSYYPGGLSIEKKMQNETMGYFTVDLSHVTLQPGEESFWGAGPEFAFRHSDWQQHWDASNDPSYVGMTSTLSPTDKIPVFDREGMLISDWGCDEQLEAPIEREAAAVVYARTGVTATGNSSHTVVYVENSGTAPLQNVEMRYYFSALEGGTPVAELYPAALFEGVLVEYLPDYWYLSVTLPEVILPGNRSRIDLGIELHYNDGWNTVWNSGDDYSRQGLDAHFKAAEGIVLLDQDGTLIWGSMPSDILPPTLTSIFPSGFWKISSLFKNKFPGGLY